MSEKKTKDWKKFKEEHEQESLDDLLEEADALSEDESDSLAASLPNDLKERLLLAERSAEEYREQFMRARAELANAHDRATRDIEAANRYGIKNFADALLPVVDSLEQALQLADQKTDTAMHQGLELTMKLLLDVLGKYGVKQLDPVGEPFDPHAQEAIAMQESSDIEPNHVITVFQKGYKLHDRVIRPARVIVSKASSS
jgi:molecular chaperone GrpE